MKTKITELLQIEYPVFQGGMAWVAEHKLAAAVSNAGGLGIIGAASAPPEVVREEIRKCKELTDKPFGVNIMLLNPNAEDVAKIVVEEGVKAVTTGAGNPGKFMELWKNAGALDTVDASYQILDQGQEDTLVQQWLIEHSWEYGFVLRYPNAKSEITGIIYEPWHYRYVGREAAREMTELDLCLEEYVDWLSAQ